MNRNLILIIIISVINIFFLGYLFKKERQRNMLLYTTIQSFTEGNKHNADSSLIESIVKRLDISDIKKLYPELKNELKEQGVKINDLQQYQRTSLSINAQINANVTRIISNQDTSFVSRYADKWIKFLNVYKLKDTTSKVNIYMPVPISQAMYIKKKPWILWRFRPMVLNQKMWTSNPYAKITFNEVIQVEQ